METLHRVWVQQFRPDESDAHCAREYTDSWVGDKIRVAEACEMTHSGAPRTSRRPPPRPVP